MSKRIKFLTTSLFIVAVVLAVFSNSFKYYTQKEHDKLYEFKKEAVDFDSLAKRWRDKETSKRAIDEIADSAGKEFFSVSVTKREKTPDSYLLSLMVLNGDELDAIVAKLLNRPVAVKRIDIINNDIGYLVTLDGLS